MMIGMHRVHVLTTGGTMEKRYVETDGLMQNTESQIPRCLSRLRLPEGEITVETLMNKDSLLMDDADRERIARHAAAAVGRGLPVVVTHGTDTMVESGRSVANHLPRLAVPIVFTGAMTPFGVEGSDAMQNLTEALLATRLLPGGVWLAFHGEVFPIGSVRKDREHSRFVAVTT